MQKSVGLIDRIPLAHQSPPSMGISEVSEGRSETSMISFLPDGLNLTRAASMVLYCLICRSFAEGNHSQVASNRCSIICAWQQK